MKISVIAIFYNSEQYIRKCLDSILSQKDVDLEVIAVNDASTDQTSNILKEYSSLFPNVKVINHRDNKGIAAARNSGLENISGDCFYLIDGDDYLTSEIALHSLSENYDDSVDWVQGSYFKCDENGAKIGEISFQNKWYNGFKTICDCFGELDFVYTHNKLINVKHRNLKFNVGCYHEDRMWNAMIFNNLNKIVSISVPTYNYVIRSGQTSRKSRSQRLYLDSGMSLMRMMSNVPQCWGGIRDTFQIVDIEKALYLWENDRIYRQRILNELKVLNTPRINTENFPRFTRLIHSMITFNIPDMLINIISKSYLKVMTYIGKDV